MNKIQRKAFIKSVTQTREQTAVQKPPVPTLDPDRQYELIQLGLGLRSQAAQSASNIHELALSLVPQIKDMHPYEAMLVVDLIAQTEPGQELVRRTLSRVSSELFATILYDLAPSTLYSRLYHHEN